MRMGGGACCSCNPHSPIRYKNRCNKFLRERRQEAGRPRRPGRVMVGAGFYYVLGGDMNWWQLSNIALVAVWKKAVGIGAEEAVGSKVSRQLLGSLGFLSMSHPFLLLLDPTINLYLLQKKEGSQTIPLDSLRRWRRWKDGDSIGRELYVGGRTDLLHMVVVRL